MTIKHKQYCAPKRVNTKNKTCLSLEELQSIATLYNENKPDKKIPVNIFNHEDKLVQEIGRRFKHCKRNDVCWLEQKEVHELYQKFKHNYRPRQPAEWRKNKRMWLSTIDIANVMNQYKDDKFNFLGVFPVDFNQKIGDMCISRDMCDFDVMRLQRQQYTSFGIVFNLDKHDLPGSHWVSCYCNIDPKSKKFGIAYYDSGGFKPPQYIKQFMREIRDQIIEKIDTSRHIFKIKYNNTQHQFKNTECGVFSMLFLILCIENPKETYHQTFLRIPTDYKDNRIHRFRDILFRPNK